MTSTSEKTREALLASLEERVKKGIHIVHEDGILYLDSIVTWEEVRDSLLEDNAARLRIIENDKQELVAAPPRGSEGKLIVVDKGNQPLACYINNRGVGTVTRDQNLPGFQSWADYKQIHKIVYGSEGSATGYQLVPCMGLSGRSTYGLISEVERLTGAPFVALGMSSWLENDPTGATGLCVFRDPNTGRTMIREESLATANPRLSKVRRMRIL